MSPEDTSDELNRLRAHVEELASQLASLKEAGQQRDSATARTAGILEAAPDGIVTIDAMGTIESVNPAIRRIFGYAPSELIGRNVRMLMPSPFREEHDGYLAYHRRTGERKIIGIGREVLAQRKDGEVFPIELSISEVQDGSRPIFTGMIRDISDRKEAEEAIREHRDRLRAIIDSAVDGIIAIDEGGSILEVNPAVERIFGYEAEALLGENVRVLMPSPYREEHDEYIHRYLESGTPRIIGFGREVRGLRRDGTTFPLYLAVSEGRVEQRRVFTGIVRDLGRLREVEERAHQAEQLAALSTITAGIAHDVGTPMTTILGYAELLQNSVQDDKNRERAGHIVDQVRRVTDLLRTLLNIARPRDATPELLELRGVLDHSLEFFREKLKGRGIIVERDYATVPAIVADRDRLEQVFLNLIVNAADAMPDGGTLTVRLAGESPDQIEVCVSDTGIGMEPEVLSRIFDAFYTTKERGKGTGLGLLVSQRIIRDHGGRIFAESEPGAGSSFCIKLPVPPVPPGQSEAGTARD